MPCEICKFVEKNIMSIKICDIHGGFLDCTIQWEEWKIEAGSSLGGIQEETWFRSFTSQTKVVKKLEGFQHCGSLYTDIIGSWLILPKPPSFGTPKILNFKSQLNLNIY